MPEILARPPRQQNPLITITLRRSTAIGIGLSLLVHLLALLIVLPKPPLSGGRQGLPGAVIAHLRPGAAAPQAAAVLPPAPEAQPEPPSRPRPEPTPRRPRETPRPPPVLARREPGARSMPTLPPLPAAPPPPVDTNPQTDFSAFTKSRQEQRLALEQLGRQTENINGGQSAGRDLTDEEKAELAIKRNLERNKPGMNGIFQILTMGQREAEFAFRGWTPGDRTTIRETYTVDAGFRGNVELAVVNRMIQIIHAHYKEADFDFDAQKQNRIIRLSARPEDHDRLVAELRREFFGMPR